MKEKRLTWYEFFAGGGMARLGLGDRWECVFANEICPRKASAYAAAFHNRRAAAASQPDAGERFRRGELLVDSVANVATSDLPPGRADLSWASFPCQDLSLAGLGAGLKGARSGTFTPFWNLMRALAGQGRAPRLVVIENVAGAITSHGGKDFAFLLDSLAGTGYRFGPMVVDAVHFLPQSRPRLFIVAMHDDVPVPDGLHAGEPAELWHPQSLRNAFAALPEALQHRWVWWHLPAPPPRRRTLSDIVEDDGCVKWNTKQQTARLVGLMTDLNRRRLQEAQDSERRAVGSVYRRTRRDEAGNKVQRAEARFDGISGCLRTPAGGSSRQIILVVDGECVRSRLLSAREAARLMGVPETYPLPANYNEAYHLFGDGLAVPAVSWLARHLLTPLAETTTIEARREDAPFGA